MKLSIRGRPNSTRNPLRQRDIKAAVRWYAQALMAPKDLARLDIRIVVDEDLYRDDNMLGCCYWRDRGRRPWKFDLAVDRNLSRRSMLGTLAHEMAHIKQYATGQLRDDLRGNKTRWEGKHLESLPYYEQPWEIEAHGLEVCLYQRYKLHLTEQKKSLARRKKR
jgi:hypothetical protein